MGNGSEQLLMRTGTTHHEFNTPTQTQPFIHLSKQLHARIGTDIATRKIHFNMTAFDG